MMTGSIPTITSSNVTKPSFSPTPPTTERHKVTPNGTNVTKPSFSPTSPNTEYHKVTPNVINVTKTTFSPTPPVTERQSPSLSVINVTSPSPHASPMSSPRTSIVNGPHVQTNRRAFELTEQKRIQISNFIRNDIRNESFESSSSISDSTSLSNSRSNSPQARAQSPSQRSISPSQRPSSPFDAVVKGSLTHKLVALESLGRNSPTSSLTRSLAPVPRSGSPAPMIGRSRSPTLDLKLGVQMVEIFISCRDLAKMDLFSRTDPIAVLLVKQFGKWTEKQRTESIVDCLQPNFVGTFKLDANDPDNDHFKVSVYDVDNMASNSFNANNLIGSVNVDMEQLLDKKRMAFDLDALSSTSSPSKKKLPRHRSTVRSKVELAVETVSPLVDRQTVQMEVGGTKLSKRGMFTGKVDSFFEVWRKVHEQARPVYRSEVVYRNFEPRWKKFTISLQKLSHGDPNIDIIFQVWHFDEKGKHELSSSTVIKWRELLQKSKIIRRFPLMKKPSGKSSEVRADGGSLMVYHCSMEEKYTLMDYIQSGMLLQSSIAIDLTYSNGHPSDAHSLHFIDDEDSNDYIFALQKVGFWARQFNRNDVTHMYGFGAKLGDHFETASANDAASNSDFDARRGSNDGTHHSDDFSLYCFPIRPRDVDSDDLIGRYRHAIYQTEFSGPTYFQPVLKKMLHERKTVDLSDSNVTAKTTFEDGFQLLTIVTDGVCNDEIQTTRLLLKKRHHALVVLLLCVGPSDFLALKELVEVVNKRTRRRMVFLKFMSRDLTSDAHVNHLYADLSNELVRLLMHHGKKPSRSDNGNAPAAVNERPLTPEVTLKRGSVRARRITMGESAIDATTTTVHMCPTCGSNVKN